MVEQRGLDLRHLNTGLLRGSREVMAAILAGISGARCLTCEAFPVD